MPDATQAVSRFPLGLSWRTDSHQFWRRPIIFDTSSVVRLRSSLWFTTDPVQRDLFLNAHHNGSLPMQVEVFWSLPLQVDSEGPTYPHLLCSYAHFIQSALVAHYLLLISTLEIFKNMWYSNHIYNWSKLQIKWSQLLRSPTFMGSPVDIKNFWN